MALTPSIPDSSTVASSVPVIVWLTVKVANSPDEPLKEKVFCSAVPFQEDSRDAEMSKSVSLEAPPSAPTATAKKSSGPWLEELSGRKLSYFYTATGYTEEDYIWLCPNGSFYKSGSSGGFGGGASGAFQSKNAGRWTVSGGVQRGTLVLAYNDGSTARYSVTRDGNKLFLDDKRYFRETSDCN